jgi:hypothetical protein
VSTLLRVSHGDQEHQIPLVLPQIDWESPNRANTGNKGYFLKLLKESLSHVDIDWVSWRRFSDIPEDPPQTSPCRQYVNDLQGYSKDFCYAGLVDYLGNPRCQMNQSQCVDAWTELLTDP